MSKRWDYKQDTFLHEFFDMLGDYIGTHDLGRPKGAAAKRAKFLKESGAWDAITRIKAAELDYMRATGAHLLVDEICEPITSQDQLHGAAQ